MNISTSRRGEKNEMTALFQRVHSGFIYVRWGTNTITSIDRHFFIIAHHKRVYIRLSVDVYIGRGYKYIDVETR